jgi:hypothetical protein
MTPEQPPVLSPDAKRDVELAACLLFTAEPSDRALSGWSPLDYMDGELLNLCGRRVLAAREGES